MSKLPTLDDRVVRLCSGLALAIPLLLYIPFIPLGAPPGDGGELLAAMYRLGVAHPSGYPLITLLGAIISPLMLGEPHFNSALLLCAIPTALTSWLLFRAQQHLAIHWLPALLSSLTWALASQTFLMATRLEVYALHALLLTNTLYCMLRYIKEPESPKWLVGAAIVAGLGVANHLTLALMLPTLGIAAIGTNWRVITDLRAVGAILLALLCGVSLYLYLPLAAFLADGASPIWNDPSSLSRIVHHISGEESRHLIRMDGIGAGLVSIWWSWVMACMPGIPLLSLLGAGFLIKREWKWVAMLVVGLIPVALYTAAYYGPDASLYHTPLLAPLIVFMGAGVDGLWRTLLEDRAPRARHLVVAIVVGGVFFNLWSARRVYFENEVTNHLAAMTHDRLPEKAILIASGDLARPLWYHAYITDSDREGFVFIDADLYDSPETEWYRAFLEARHPKVSFPAPDITGKARQEVWRKKIASENGGDYRTFAILEKKWEGARSSARFDGLFHEIIPGIKRAPKHSMARRAFSARRAMPRAGAPIFHSASTHHALSEERPIACVVDWLPHDTFDATWTFDGPGDQKHAFKPLQINAKDARGFQLLQPRMQSVGEWTCTITSKHATITVPFEVTP